MTSETRETIVEHGIASHVTNQSTNQTLTKEQQVVNHGVTKDAVATQAKSSTEVVRQVVLTEGELLPWKGFWWKVHLNNETSTVELQQGKPTSSTTNLVARATRWRHQHPRATDGLRVGSVSGLQVQPAALRSTESQS